ncbi:hypothetical protein [Terriglobus roseus]|uniref:Outer membrane protein beta-barrel domain-containing protein n=1 Tax=Terriglobus roseus TaxID=392734 RepID=A0A1H4U878_9BACT|nr:hypothetical protein [Terriglobus roseus]SEC64903.1 hypothetical protein SAMN05443244_3990 [Terriglobus roseus]
MRRAASGNRARVLGVLALSLLTVTLHAQTRQGQASDIPVALRFVATEANAPPGSCGCFWLKGGAIDAALPLHRRLLAEVELAASTVDRVPATTRGLSEITLLAGPRYTVPLHHATASAHALFGAVRGFDADFVLRANRADTSTNFAMAFGGALELPLSRSFSLRVAEVDFIQTNLPNGANNRQRNIRMGAGIVFHVTLPTGR